MWMSGFYSPQALLTAILQNHARKHKIPINELTFNVKVIQSPRKLESGDKSVSTSSSGEMWDADLIDHNVEGVYIRGLFLDGACWNPTK